MRPPVSLYLPSTLIGVLVSSYSSFTDMLLLIEFPDNSTNKTWYNRTTRRTYRLESVCVLAGSDWILLGSNPNIAAPRRLPKRWSLNIVVFGHITTEIKVNTARVDTHQALFKAMVPYNKNNTPLDISAGCAFSFLWPTKWQLLKNWA